MPASDNITFPTQPKKVVQVIISVITFTVLNVWLVWLWIATQILARPLEFYRHLHNGAFGPVPSDPLKEPGLVSKLLKKRVAVIGAGPSGIAAVRECRAFGHDCECFEKASSFGGVFRSYTYKGGQFTSSNFMTAFSAFPLSSRDLPARQLGWQEYLDYLSDYIDFFGIRHHFRFNVEVVKAVFCRKSATWNLTFRDSKGLVWSSEYDHLMVCAGLSSRPKVPRWRGRELFKGSVIHSSAFKDAAAFMGKRVVVVGLGESGSDISALLAPQAEKVLITARNGPGALIPRLAAGVPTDVDTCRAYHSLPRDWFPTAPNTGALWHQVKIILEDLFASPSDETARQRVQQVKPTTFSPFRHASTKSTRFVGAIVEGGAVYRESEVDHIDEVSVTLKDGTCFCCDAIIACTGYEPAMPWLPEDLCSLHPRDLYKHAIHPKYRDSLAFIGWVRPSVGSIPPLSEMQSRYFALLISGLRALPPVDVLENLILRDRQKEEWQFPYDCHSKPALTDFFGMLTSLAALVGSSPPMAWLFFHDPVLWFYILVGPLVSAQFTLFDYVDTGFGTTVAKLIKVLEELDIFHV
ncbi:hypothetical protein CYMTET_10556 [Cymbomonas tetramitiformis]|uniref:Flavin-containing monooxygenase n=1 Tax=Cymbomonas tetramitiformis TaxID=36881 RepID=A0AAE0GP98_9CHLO|nr:hypothetical protein CYMTET_10556 [Cymbomonas tetramitiformis]|eukprot:gene23296-28192_t